MASPFQLADIAALKAWVPDVGQANDEQLDVCLNAATRQIQGMTGRAFQRQAVIERLSGKNAQGPDKDTLLLNAAYAPIDVTVPVIVTENGNAVSATFTYDTSAIVFVDAGPPGIIPATPKLTRQIAAAMLVTGQYPYSSSWYPGVGNITVSWTGGFAPAAIPTEIAQVCCYCAWDMFKGPTRMNKTSRSGQGASSSFTNELPYWATQIIEMWRLR